MPGNHPTQCNHPHPEDADTTCQRVHRHPSDHEAVVDNAGTPRERVSWVRSVTVPNDDDAHGTVEVPLPASLERCGALHPRGALKCTRPDGHATPHMSSTTGPTWPRALVEHAPLPVTPRMPALHIDRDLLAVHVRADVRVVALLDDDEVASLDLGSVSVADPDRIAGDLATLLRSALRLLEGDGPASVAPPAWFERELAAHGVLPEPFDVAEHERRYAETVKRVHDKVADGSGTALPVPLASLYEGVGVPDLQLFTWAEVAARADAAYKDRHRHVLPFPRLYDQHETPRPESGHEHAPAQHRDGIPPWCNTCGVGPGATVFRGDRLLTAVGEL